MAEPTCFSQLVQDCSDRLSANGVDALGALFDLTSHRLVRFAVTLTRNQHDAEDSVQTVLVRVAGRPQLLSAADCPWAYLLRMVRNEALLFGRRKQRRPETEETHRAVWSALRMLPPEQAEVVVLKIWEELTFAQIGQILELSPNTAASRYQYAMAKLSKSLSKQHREVRGG